MADLKALLETKQEALDMIEDAVPVDEREAGYYGDFRILNDFAAPIKKVGNQYFPADDAEIALMEHHVKMGHVTKVA